MLFLNSHHLTFMFRAEIPLGFNVYLPTWSIENKVWDIMSRKYVRNSFTFILKLYLRSSQLPCYTLLEFVSQDLL